MNFLVEGNCITKQQGNELFQSIITSLFKGEVLLDFSQVRYYAPPFFHELFDQIFQHESFQLILKRLKQKGLNFSGEKIFSQSIKCYSQKLDPSLPTSSIELNQIVIVGGQRTPIIHMSNEVMTVISKSGEAEWLTKWGEIFSDQEDYEQLLLDNIAQADQYRSSKLENTPTLRCERCGKQVRTLSFPPSIRLIYSRSPSAVRILTCYVASSNKR